MATNQPIPTEDEYNAFWECRPRIINGKKRDAEKETLFDALSQGGDLLKESMQKKNDDEALNAIREFSTAE